MPLERWRQSKEHTSPGFTWLARRRPPPNHLGTAQKDLLRGQEDFVFSVVFSSRGDRIASGSEDRTVRVWDACAGQCLEVIQEAHDAEAIASGPPQFPLRTISRGHETLVERADSGQLVASLPISLEHVTTHPNGRTWAGASGNHLCIISLEGDPSAPPPEPPGRQ